MKKLLIIVLLIFGIHHMHAQKITSIETEGNLESPNPCDCVELSEVTNEHNPADILNGMGKCIELKDYEKAVKLFAIAGAYGKYDTYRVKDKTAHQALVVLQQKTLLNISEEDKKQITSILQKTFERDSEELNTVCQAIQKIGIPKYHPRYMIQHGMQAFTKKEGDDGLVEEFDSEKSWNLVLKNFLHCGE